MAREYLQEEIEDILINIGEARRTISGEFMSIGCLLGIGGNKFHIYSTKYPMKKLEELFKDASNVVLHKSGKIKSF